MLPSLWFKAHYVDDSQSVSISHTPISCSYQTTYWQTLFHKAKLSWKTPHQPLNNYAQPKTCVPFSKQGTFHHFLWFIADIFFSISHPLSRESAKGYSSYLIEYRCISLISLELDFHYLGLYYFNSTIIFLLSPL